MLHMLNKFYFNKRILIFICVNGIIIVMTNLTHFCNPLSEILRLQVLFFMKNVKELYK